MTAAPRVFVVEDHRLFAEALCLALSLRGYEAAHVPPVESLTRLLQRLTRSHPDLVLLDLDLGASGEGDGLVRPLVQAGVKVVILTASTEPHRWGGCLARGAHAVVAKERPLGERVVLAHLMAGHTVAEIARREHLAEATVRTQVKSVLAKLNVSSQLAAVGLAHEMEWQAPEVGRRRSEG